MKLAYFDCFAGAGGDMIAAAMLDAGLDEQFLKDQIDSLGIEGLEIKVSRAVKRGINAISFEPISTTKQEFRNLKIISKIISKSGISESAKQRSLQIFTDLADAEAKVHGKDISEIHFHEIGAVDTIVDIVSACVGLEALGIEKVFCSALSVGGGTVECEHGILPVPAPATVELLEKAKAPIVGGPVNFELLTPTAAAILTNINNAFTAAPAMTIEATGYGAGKRDIKGLANVLRLMIGNDNVDEGVADTVCVLETNVDDASGEMISFVMERLFASGALDVYTTAIQMKGNRPAVKISVICEPKQIEQMQAVLFSEGITLGIRKQFFERAKLKRNTETVKTQYGQIRIKTGIFNGKVVTFKPEYSDCSKAAIENKVPFNAVVQAAKESYLNRNEQI